MNFIEINNDISFWTGTDTSSNSSFPLSDRLLSINEWYRIVNQWIWDASSAWEYDDSNYGTLPIAIQTLEDGVGNYELPTNAQKVMGVEIKKKDGSKVKLEHFDRSQLDVAYDEYEKDDGLPRKFDVIANSIQLKPAPKGSEVTTTSGLLVWLSRGIKEFTATSTTKEPGFVADFHRVLSLGSSADYLMANDADMTKQNKITGRINSYKKSLQTYYGSRNEATKGRIIPRELNGGSGSFNTSV